MTTTVSTREAVELVASLFDYPGETFASDLNRAAHDLDAIGTRAGEPLHEFASEISKLTLSALQTTYTSTFDLAPSCPPYLGTHLFGEEARERTALMAGLRKSVHDAGGFPSPHELPDHISEVLRFATLYREDEWDELTALVVLPALGKMESILSATANPYRHLVRAARLLCSEGGAR